MFIVQQHEAGDCTTFSPLVTPPWCKYLPEMMENNSSNASKKLPVMVHTCWEEAAPANLLLLQLSGRNVDTVNTCNAA